MPNGRNAEHILRRNADRAELRQLLPDFGRNAENRRQQKCKRVRGRKSGASDRVGERLLLGSLGGLYFVSITKPRA